MSQKNNILIRMCRMVGKICWEFAFLFADVTQFCRALLVAAYAMKNSMCHSIWGGFE